MSLKIAYMGTPDFAVPALENLIDNPAYEVACVYTQPPRPKGRGQKVQVSPVHAVALAHDIPVHTPRSLKKEPEVIAEMAILDLDVIIVAAYGLILPKTVLEIPRYGCLNIHASLLPRWRGAAPIQYSIWKGDDKTGITIMQMEEGLDTGPMIEKRAVKIRPTTTSQSLHDELAALGAAMVEDVLDNLDADGKLESEVQDCSQTSYAGMLCKDDGRVDWSRDAKEIDCQIRALNPWPGVWTMNDDGQRLKIIEAELVSESFTEAPGILIDRVGHVACGHDTALRIIKIQPENSKKMDIVSAINGGYLTPGILLD